MPSSNRQLGRYAIREQLGRGALGAVYLGVDPSLDRTVVVKTFPISESPKAERFSLGQRFATEARAAGNLRHEGIVSVYDVGQQGDVAFIVMEYLNGGSLANRLRSHGPLPPEDVCRLVQALANALDYAHAQGVVHRDIKPSNILFDENARPKLADFGIAKMSEVELTHPGTLIGTPAYMAPEQIKGDKIDARTDQWSLAIVAYEALTGQRPFTATEIPEAIHRIVSGDVLSDDRRLSPTVRTVLGRALENNPDNRFPTCGELATSFCQALQLDGPRSVEPGVAPGQADAPGDLAAIPSQQLPSVRPPVTQQHSTTEGAKSAKVPDLTLTQMRGVEVPEGVTGSQIFPPTGFFSSSTDRYVEIKSSLQFFRDGLQREYEELSGQAKLTYKLWVVCVALGFFVLLTGVGLMFANRIAQGAITSASTVLLYFIQRVFQQREDHYRAAAAQKHANLEYGNQWLLVIQSIDAMEDSKDRATRQASLVDALTDRLKANQVMPIRSNGRTKAKSAKKAQPLA